MKKFRLDTRAMTAGLLTNLAYGLLFCGVIAIPAMVVLSDSSGGVWTGLLFIVPFLLTWLIREYCRGFTLFACAHVLLALAVPGAVFLITHDWLLCAAALAFMAASLIFSFFRRMSARPLRLTAAMMPAAAGFYVLAGLLVDRLAGISLYGVYALFIAVIFLLYLLTTQMSNIDETLDTTGNFRHIESVRRFNNKTTAMFLAAAALLILVVSMLPVSNGIWAVLGLLQNGLVMFLRLLGRLFSGSAEETPAAADEPVPTNAPMDLSELLGDYDTRDPLLSDEAFQALVFAGLAIALVGVIVYLVRNARRRFGGGDISGDLLEFVPSDGHDLVERVRRSFSLFGPRFGDGNNARVRRLFYKRVRDYHRKNHIAVPSSETALEISERMRDGGSGGDIPALGSLYGRARYGSGEMTEEV